MADFYKTIEGNKQEVREFVDSNQGTAAAGRGVALNDNGVISSDLIEGSEVSIRPASEALGAGEFVNIFDDGGTASARLADANAFGTRAIGYVTDNVANGDPATILSEGILTGFTGLTIGAPVFLDPATPGGVTQAPPVPGSGDIWQKVGVADTATDIRVEIEEAICL